MKIKEIYANIKGYEGLYQVSNLGNVKSLKRIIRRPKGNNYQVNARVMKPRLSRTGYAIVNLSKEGVMETFQVHQLVSFAFLGHGRMKFIKVVDHIDNDKTNNNLYNLQIISNRENSSKDKKNGTSKYVGVSWHKSRKKWHSAIRFKGKKIWLGSFDYEIEAHESYKRALSELVN